jgi:hypothetical protein
MTDEQQDPMWGVFRRGRRGSDLASMSPDGEDAVFATERDADEWRIFHAITGRVAEVVWTNFGWMEKSEWEVSK